MDALYNTHVKLLASDFLALSPNKSDPSSFSRKGMSVSRAETIGFVVTRDLKPGKFIRFTIDDGTGCIPCVLWLNQLTSPYFSKRSPPGVRSIAAMAAKFASQIQLGVVARVRGRITGYRGTVQITVSDVVLEMDPNAQVLHWLDCLRMEKIEENERVDDLMAKNEQVSVYMKSGDKKRQQIGTVTRSLASSNETDF